MSTTLRRVLGSERGSVPLALLVVIIMAGLTSIISARTVAQERSVRHDNEFTTAVHAAEAGVAEAAFRLNNHLVLGTSGSGTGTANGYDYAWTANKEGPFGPWVVTSTGTGPTAVSRTVRAELADRPIFNTALSTHLGVNFQGGNAADSYDSATQLRCSGPHPDCFGIVASNGNIDMGSSGGGTNYADRVHVHDWANPENTGPERCAPSNSVYCDETRDPQHRYNIDEPLNIRGQVDFVQELLDGCDSFPSWRASENVTGSGDPAAATLDPGSPSSHPQVGDYHCFSALRFDQKTQLPSSVTPEDPLIVVVRDRMKIDAHVEINCGGCKNGFPASPKMPAARRLQFFTLAEDDFDTDNNVLAAIQIRQHAKVSAAVYAPNASCGNQQSNAHVEIYGSLVCKAVLNQGGWKFHFDEDLLAGARTGQFALQRWQEE